MKAEHATAILIFDYVAALTFGGVAAVTAWYVVPSSLPDPAAMVLGMIVGTISAVPVLGLFTFLLGGFEIVVMSTLIGMFAGMIGATMGGTDWSGHLLLGALIGFCLQTLLRVSDRRLRGEVRQSE